MTSLKEKYENDPLYARAVDLMESLINESKYTPSEMREMAVLASIHYELRYGITHYASVLPDVNKAFKTLEEYRDKEKKEAEKRKKKNDSR